MSDQEMSDQFKAALSESKKNEKDLEFYRMKVLKVARILASHRAGTDVQVCDRVAIGDHLEVLLGEKWLKGCVIDITPDEDDIKMDQLHIRVLMEKQPRIDGKAVSYDEIKLECQRSATYGMILNWNGIRPVSCPSLNIHKGGFTLQQDKVTVTKEISEVIDLFHNYPNTEVL